MSRRLVKMISVVLVGVVLLSVPGFVGCGNGGEAGLQQVRIGILTDFTGPAAFAARQATNAIVDYFRLLEETDPIPGVKVKIMTYDTRSDFSRVVPGYIWLKGQGVISVYPISGDDLTLLEPRLAGDEISGINAFLSESSLLSGWTFYQGVSNEQEGETAMQWIMDTWDYAGKGRPPKVGHVGWVRASSLLFQAGIDRILTAYPNKFQWVGMDRVPLGTSTWAAEIGRLKNCDYIYFSMVGTMLGSFVKEARARGYGASFVSCTIGFPGFWGQIRPVVPADQLYGCYFAHFVPWWSGDIPYINSLKEAISRYRPGETEQLVAGTGPVSAWGIAMFMADAIRRAAEKVGAENRVEGVALRDALAETNMTVEGFDYQWRFSPQRPLLMPYMKMLEWSVGESTWKFISAPFLPRSLAG